MPVEAVVTTHIVLVSYPALDYKKPRHKQWWTVERGSSWKVAYNDDPPILNGIALISNFLYCCLSNKVGCVLEAV
jgi:hypothetical protein